MKKFSLHPCGNYRESYKQELSIFETHFGRIFLCLFLVVLFFVAPFIVSPYTLYILNIIGIAAIAAVGLNILIGYTGQISLGHGAFFGVGAYAAAILATRLDVSFLIAIPAAGIITAGGGMVFCLPSRRLKRLFFKIGALSGQFVIEYF